MRRELARPKLRLLLKAMLVEILYFDGCPNYLGARELVERLAAEIGADPEIRMVEVPDVETAEADRDFFADLEGAVACYVACGDHVTIAAQFVAIGDAGHYG